MLNRWSLASGSHPKVFALVALLACTLPFAAAQDVRARWAAAPKAAADAAPARNVILFLGDGMNVSTVTAARILEGQQRGHTGEENFLSFESFPNTALAKTYANDSQVNDSAGTMSSIVTGVKGNMGVLSMNQRAQYGQVNTANGNRAATILELAKQRGMSAGVVSTTRLSHATPAACYSHSVHRDWESDSNLSADAKVAGLKDIARQLIEFSYGGGLDVALAGGRAQFMPKEAADPEYPSKKGSRSDQRDLTKEWQDKGAGWKYVWNQTQFDSINPATTDHLLGLFEPSHMQYEADRAKDTAGEPSLSQMTSKAIDILQKNSKGFFLMVEGGRIDHAHHANNAYRALTDTIEFANAVSVAMQKTDPSDTLIIVTADHGHMMTIAGYPARGNPILGKVLERGAVVPNYTKDTNGTPFTTLAYANGPGYKTPRVDPTFVNTEHADYMQDAAVPLSEDTHSGEDTPVYAAGAGSAHFRGVMDQNWLFNAMLKAMGRSWGVTE